MAKVSELSRLGKVCKKNACNFVDGQICYMQVCADLYSASTADSLPSEETVSLLAEVLYELPDLGDALLRAVGLIHLRLEIHIACLHRSVDELSDAINVSTCERTDTGQHAAAARFYRLLALFDVPAKEAAEKRAELHRLWLRVANLLSSGTSTLDRSMVLSCLLAEKSQSTCRWFIKLLNAADLHHLISRNVPVQISSMYSHATTPSYTVPASSTIIEQTLAIDNNMGSAKDGEKVVDDSGFIRSTIDKTAVLHNLPSSISNDIVCMFALSSTACHRAAWHHLYLMCVERRIHFLDLFLVCNLSLFYVYTLCIAYYFQCRFNLMAGADAFYARSIMTEWHVVLDEFSLLSCLNALMLLCPCTS